MSGVENQVAVHDVVFPEDGAIDNLSDAMAKVSLRPDKNSSSQSPESVADSLNKDKNDIHGRPFVMYSRLHLLLLHKSPLVCTPTGMPALKDWFGTESDQGNLKKDSEALPQPNARDRRFRRDAEDGEGAARPSFRGAAITQPSQMGNFKHQSIRATDRDRDRETDREQERDSRVKDGQERLRNLSDKYDRDRRALSSMQQLRGKDRDLAPHLGGTSSRIASQSQQAPSNRQLDSREPSKKKDGETSEDWRRESTRTGRERSDNPRRDRDERDRPRSRVRDSSRQRRDVSPSRRDRDDRDRDRRGDRDDHQKETTGYRKDREDRDLDRESEVDDPRRWRDDGKRDERIAARRDRERDKDRVRDRTAAWDASDRQDRRWAPADDRDGRNKRVAGRERKPDEAKDRDDRKDRDREREKEREKEPAWMDTYIPSSGSNGLGRAPGDLDDIQAFKREIKEREQKEQGTTAQDDDRSGDFEGKTNTSEPHLDEIQLFKLMMKREEQKKKADQSPLAGPSLLADASSDTKDSTPTNASPPLPQAEPAPHDGSRVPLSMLSSPLSSVAPGVSAGGSRFFPKPIPTDLPAPQALPKPSIEALSAPVPSAPHTAAPPGCRLLSFTSKTPQGSVGHTPPSYTGSHSPVSLSKNGTPASNSTILSNGPLSTTHHNDNMDAVRATRGFSPFEEAREGLGLSPLDALTVPMSGPLPSHSVPYEQLNSGIAAAKGSRFAKFFDGKGRDSQPGMGKVPMGGPTPAQRGELSGYNGIPTGNPDARAMEDIFAMLSNSAHGQRPHILPEALASDAAHFNHPSNLHHLQNQLGHSQHYPGHTRLDSLYDSRLDDRNFVPDGMVPGLRSAAPPRSRQNGAMLSDIDDSMQFGGQRGPPQMYQGLHQANMNRNGGIPLQSSQFRGGPSPNPLQPSSQRLPPGLANLGGRPPHEPAQFLNSSMAIPVMPPSNSSFNNFPPGGVGFNGAPQMRVPHPGGTHQLHGHNAMQGLMHPGGLNPAQAQLLGLNGANGMPSGLRGPNGGFGQQGSKQQQQQQQQIPPHMLPLHYQQQGPPGSTNQPAHDLMALLMSGGRRE
ncbi:hypothetical protein DFJ58DRAFT_768226 [Suillus subalutaceus]|uniref:uncharacterized protein n=1 Tax=Suillus subalutaceus TaxID=48586 RepID=UPI001B882162|nr:uncharacterized protein DFJ58DRAFT_768226 [Suillus subalutaceus]KAG1867883.1 hypothetical protein DFJ58DRAFT_768226 [Suillus subalutaceus]